MKRTLSISWNHTTEVFEITVTDDNYKEAMVVFQGKNWMEIIHALTKNDWASLDGKPLTTSRWLAM